MRIEISKHADCERCHWFDDAGGCVFKWHTREGDNLRPGPDCKPDIYELVSEKEMAGMLDDIEVLNAEADGVKVVCDTLRAENERLRNILEEIPRRIPAHSQGEFFVEHFDPNGEYVGAEQVNPADIIASIHGLVLAALDGDTLKQQ